MIAPQRISSIENYAERKLIEKHGNANQLERHSVGLLPNDELCALARATLYAPFAAFRRWDKIAERDVRHDDSCLDGASSDNPAIRSIRFITRPTTSVTGDQWTAYKAIYDAMIAGVAIREHNAPGQVDIIEHVGICSRCTRETIGRSASVGIEWAGRNFTREYQLVVP